MLPNKVFGKYDWNINGKTGVGAAWVVAAFVLPMLVWAVFMLARMSGWVRQPRPIRRGRWYGCCFLCLAC